MSPYFFVIISLYDEFVKIYNEEIEIFTAKIGYLLTFSQLRCIITEFCVEILI